MFFLKLILAFILFGTIGYLSMLGGRSLSRWLHGEQPPEKEQYPYARGYGALVGLTLMLLLVFVIEVFEFMLLIFG